MRWKLFSSVWKCAWRRVRPAMVEYPLLALLAAAACIAVPLGAALAGARLAEPFEGVRADPASLGSLALGIGATGIVAGAAFALLAPSSGLLGRRLEGAPISRVSAAWSLTVAPACAAGAVLLAPPALFAVALVGERGLALVAAGAGAVLLGAALGEGLRLCSRGVPVGAAFAAVVGVVWAVGGLVSGAGPEQGPAAALVPMLGRGSAARPLCTLLAAAVVGAALWLAACAVPRADHRGLREARMTRLPRGVHAALSVATARRLVRRPELQVQAFAAVFVPLAAAGALHFALEVGGEPLLGFAAGLSLTAAALIPAAAHGLGLDAAWLFAAAPRSRTGLATAVAAAGVVVAAALVVATSLLAVPVARASPATYLELEGVVAFVLGCAALGGSTVPWRPDRLLQQLGSYGATAAVVIVAWAALGRLEDPAAAVGLDGSAFSLAVGNATLVLGLVGSGAMAR